MTTKVTVDAHAGWPVKVEAIDTYDGESKTTELAVVPAFEKRDFYVTSTRQIVVTEMPKGS
jgi:hypothetical protein